MGTLRKVAGAKCRCIKRTVNVGQDGYIFKAYLKEQGLGRWFWGFQDEWRGFGLPVSDEEVSEGKRVQEESCRPWVVEKESSGVRFLIYGKNKQAYWKFRETHGAAPISA